MKVGIVTFHYNNNFGAALQCYALQRAIKELGHEVDVIDYVPPGGELKPFWRGWNIRSGQFLKKVRQRLLQLKYERKASRAFESFRNSYFSLSARCTTLDQVRRVATQYDAVVCGSDQVWVFERPSVYFLDLGDQFKGLKISYAACCGHNQQHPGEGEKIRNLVNRLDSISVRNDFSKEIVSAYTAKPISITADPTLLVDFDELMEERPLPCADYILMYSLSGDMDGGQQKIIDAIRKKVGDLPVVAVVANSCPRKSACAQYNIFDANPRQWVWLIAHARFVYTDSFHGALFCVKYNRPFMADYKEKWRSLRLLDVATRYGFENNIASSVDDAVQKIQRVEDDYADAHALINKHAKESLQFLSGALST